MRQDRMSGLACNDENDHQKAKELDLDDSM